MTLIQLKDIYQKKIKLNIKKQDLKNPLVLIYIITYNKIRGLGFTREDFLNVIDMFDLKRTDSMRRNILMYIIRHNRDILFTKEDIICIFDKFDLTQKTFLVIMF